MFAIAPRTVLVSGTISDEATAMTMKTILLICVYLLSGNSMAAAQDKQSEAIEIPLKETWGWNIPGTRNIGTLEPNRPQKYAHGPLLEQIRRKLADSPAQGKQARAGFAVRGTGLEALSEVRDVLVGKKKPRDTFPMGSAISVVFFSYQTGSYVHLRRIEQDGNVIKIYYRFVPHRTREVTDHLALIPLTKLMAGKVRVEINRSPVDEELVDGAQRSVSEENARRIVCQPFSFAVGESSSREEETLLPGATPIALESIWAYNTPGTLDIRELDAVKKPTGIIEHPIVNQMARALSARRKEREKAGPAFIVTGTDSDALRNAHAVVTNQRESLIEFPPDTDLSLFFYSTMSGRYVHIISAERLDNLITVKYRFVSHPTADTTTHFALIPLGKLPEGKFQVKIIQLPPIDIEGRAAKPLSDPEPIVCQGSSFTVHGG